MTLASNPTNTLSVQETLDAILATVKASTRPWLSCQEAMDYLGVGRSTLDLYRAQGRIRYAKLPNSEVRFRRADLEAFLEDLVVA